MSDTVATMVLQMDKEVCELNKDLEIIIITCFGPNRDKKLTAGQIKAYTKKYIKESDSNIQKKIERMAKRNIFCIKL